MSRKTDEELMNEMKQQVKDSKEKIRKLKGEPADEDEEAEAEEEESAPLNKNPQQQVVEREINIALLNDKMNFIISLLQTKK